MQSENKKAKRNKILIYTLFPLALIIAFVGGYFSRYLFQSKAVNTTADIVAIMEKVGYVYDPVTGEERALTEEEIADAIVNGFLDKYSAYYTEEEYNTVNANGEGRFSGLGVTISADGYIYSVTLNSPAELAGLEEGDLVISASVDGGEEVLHSQSEQFRALILNAVNGQTIRFNIVRGETNIAVEMVKGSFVASYVKYYDDTTTLNFRTDDGLKLKPTPTDGGMTGLDQATAYIKLVAFSGNADEQIGEALDYMKSRGKSKLILDLRNNGGGYTDTLEGIASYFIYNDGERKSLICYAEGKNKSQSFYTNGNNFYSNITSISVLANENTASASECLIGAMLHYGDCFDQSKLVIEKTADGAAKTYGKGIMQTTYKLINGGAIKLTTAKMYLPDKATSIHGVGFRPNEENAVNPSEALNRAIAVLG